jgi:hypothetical protein
MKLADCPVRVVRDGHDVTPIGYSGAANSEMLPIDKGVPIPDRGLPHDVLMRTLRAMEVGDSIFVKRSCTTKI